MRIFSRLFTLFLASAVLITVLPATKISAVTTTCNSYEGSNIGTQNYSRWSSVVDSYLTVCENGNLMKVQNTNSDGIVIEYYDDSFNYVSYRIIPTELPIWGGFYESDSNYYVVSGQKNDSESANVEVIRVTKYDKSWNRLGAASLKDCNTTVPFDAGSCRMDMCGKYLIVRTCHEMYKSSDGYNHQANATLQVDTDKMQIAASYFGVMNNEYGYASHSFNQFIKMDGNNIVAVDHGDAYPRSIALTKYTTDASTGNFVPTYSKRCKVVELLKIPGAIGENATNATVGGFEISNNCYLVAGNSVVQDESNLSRTTRNIYVAAVNKSTNEVTMNWVTSHAEGKTTTTTPHLVKINNNQYMLMWTRADKVFYTLIDGSGKVTSTIYSKVGNLSDCVPIVKDNKVIWYTWDDGQIVFYSIYLSKLSYVKVTEVNNGHKYQNDGVTGGVATLVCSQCGQQENVKVPTSYSTWWNENGGSGYYYSGFTSTKYVGDQLYCWNTFSESGIDDEMEFIVDDPSIISVEQTNDTNAIFTMKKAGTTKITVRPKWNPNIGKSYNVTVKNNVVMEINGFQISYTAKGIRTVYSVSDPKKEVVSGGLIYGLSDYASVNDMVVNSNNSCVYDFAATSEGRMNSTVSTLQSAKSYTMTMKFEGFGADFFKADTMVRAYARLSNGDYVYSNVVNYSVYKVADTLYKNNYMNTKEAHTFLYTDILSKVNSKYKKVNFLSGNSLVSP